jgi:outer membrane receptor protein involved in Fe transport
MGTKTMKTPRFSVGLLFPWVPGIFLLFWSTAVLCGTTGKISGRVLDGKHEPLPGAAVVLVGTSLGAATDIDGYYNIINIPPGVYGVQFRLVGFRQLTINEIQVSVNNTTKVDAVLEETLIESGEVVVTAKKPVVDVNLTSTVATITDKDIRALPVQELQDIVNLQAGVVDGHFRGGRDGEVQYQVNGVSVNNLYDNKSSIKIDRSLIQEVQVITGTFDAEYGQAMSGVVNTVLKSGGEQFQWNAEALGGDWLYASGGYRNLTYKSRPGAQQNYQISVSGPTGLPETYFLLSGRRYVFDDYLYGERRFNPLDTTNMSNLALRAASPSGDGKVVPIGYTREWSGLAKITNRSIPQVELTYQGVFDYVQGRGTNFYWRLNPDGESTQKTISAVHGLDWTHTLSRSTFYTLSLRENYFDYRDWVYDDFYDARYDLAGTSKSLPLYEYGASLGGVDYGRFKQKTNTVVVKGALTAQVTREHQFKLGAEFQRSNVQFGTPGTLAFRTVGGDNILVRYVDFPPDYPGVQTYDPTSAAVYAQDQIEWNDLTIRAGVRFEFFDARSYVPSDPANPADSIQGVPSSYPQRTTKKTSFAPRLGISYPITDHSSVFFSYGHFYQFPPLGQIFGNSNYQVLARIQGGSDNYGVLGNPDIKPERTVQYEFGYKAALTDFLGLSVNIFYKDIRDLLGVEFVSTYNDAMYTRLTNIDFGTVKGITISLDQRRIGILSSTIDYTWQMAEGNASDPSETALRAANHEDPRPRQVPLNWDQRSTLNLTVQLSQPENYSVSAILRFGSGTPYTPEVGSGFGAAIEPNSGTKPSGILVDMRAEKYFSLAGMNMSLFARVLNLFDATYFNEGVFSSTGSPYYSLKPVVDRNSLADPTRLHAPRRIEVGLSLNSL